MKSTNWTSAQIANQKGKNVLITGASSGLGLEAATVLSQKGAHVIMAVRNVAKGNEAMNQIKKRHPQANISVMQLDLADLESIHQFSRDFHAQFTQLHLLLNNAGIMFPPSRQVTRQGFEIQFGTNHLGHFALTGLLLDILKSTPHSRVVNQSSIMHKWKSDLKIEEANNAMNYNQYNSYAISKLSNLLFTYELDRRLKKHHLDVIATASHPGYTATNLQRSSGFVAKVLNVLWAQQIQMGTLPILRAATDPDLKGSEYFGPTKMMETRGYPQLVRSSDKSYDIALAAQLWTLSEQLTNITYQFEKE